MVSCTFPGFTTLGGGENSGALSPARFGEGHVIVVSEDIGVQGATVGSVGVTETDRLSMSG